jgi:putative transcriptional regulator
MAVVHEAASVLHSVGAIDKTTMREFDDICLRPMKPQSAAKVRTQHIDARL